ncbi:M48 family metallopeptidase [Thauera linaloolentis]|uniref:Peptidase M48 Ste24p n=1 Tax=Thauera linaloolentis (strain DSM 12138 / JCM 21573 / CCUG 41526 / CIP 105981 / IAM 15112 / NBRC 102519 / 47Lol) TaxID=1123367 RepID=N6ZDA9_THAL4|nr:M48 family metallopeptidase [Thauera linaloolentis]ENO90169.1 peptidase M48 Ste24p [Thauera linaloolentis 47Lol = DSM 12138]MCM8564694.1 M48 family metallopeptidase [Thauera linaloolentis]
MKSMYASLLPAVLAATITVACQTVQTTQAGAVGVQRSQMMMVSAQEVEQASGKQYQEMLNEARKKNALNRDAATVQRVRRIVARLTPHTGVFRSDAPAWKWEVNVFSSDELNAWCMAGGKMAIYTGLIDRLKLSDDEIAAVMGHEIAHALREHARERISKSMATGIGLSVAGAVLGVGQVGQDLMGKVAQVTFELPNSREHETEADRMGVELAARAGYDPRAAVTLWDKMATQSSGAPPQWLSTHPSHASRQRDLADYASKVMPLYQAARR